MSNVHVSTIPLVTIVKIAQMLTPKMNGNQERFTLYPLHFQTLPLILNCVVSYGRNHTHMAGVLMMDRWLFSMKWILQGSYRYSKANECVKRELNSRQIDRISRFGCNCNGHSERCEGVGRETYCNGCRDNTIGALFKFDQLT